MLIDNVQNNREEFRDMVTGFFTVRGLQFIKEVMSDQTKFRMVLAIQPLQHNNYGR